MFEVKPVFLSSQPIICLAGQPLLFHGKTLFFVVEITKFKICVTAPHIYIVGDINLKVLKKSSGWLFPDEIWLINAPILIYILACMYNIDIWIHIFINIHYISMYIVCMYIYMCV